MSDQAPVRGGEVVLELALLLQEGSTAHPGPVGVFRFFFGFVLIISIYSSFFGFTYWISKDE
jgi:hypothetical protein